jgi:lipopolysaccharide biosynthesis protein
VSKSLAAERPAAIVAASAQKPTNTIPNDTAPYVIADTLDQPRVAVVIHAFYMELLPGMLKSVLAAGFKFDLLVTCPEGVVEKVKYRLREYGVTDSHIESVPNRGRDIAPFLRMLRLVHTRGYSILLKLHTKQSSHRPDGATWRGSMLEALLTPTAARAAIHALSGQSVFGIVGPRSHVLSLQRYPGANLVRVQELARTLGVEPANDDGAAFVAGTMFFARVDALTPLLNLGLDETDFEPEIGQIDGTLAHSIERVIGYSAAAAGYRLGSIEGQTANVVEAAPGDAVYRFGMSGGG